MYGSLLRLDHRGRHPRPTPSRANEEAAMSLIEPFLAFVAGVISFVSPCCLPMVPMYLSYLAGIAGCSTTGPVLQPLGATGTFAVARPSRLLIVLHAAAFVLGFSAVF